MRIGELAGLVGISTRAIRHYHDVGLLAEPARKANGYREYSLRDAVELARVRRLTELGLGLDRDTTVHFMWMHVHPYAESLQLRDETIDRIVWKGNVKNDPDSKRAIILTTDTYSSQDGLLLHRDHKYELIATYQNPTPHPVDAMASLWMYVRAD